jgi:hypothetical protein
MQFTHYDLGQKRGGEIIEVTLQGSAANVRLMDSSNFNSYRNGRRHRYQGCLLKSRRIGFKYLGLGTGILQSICLGLRGTVRSSIRQLPGTLPTAQEAPLSSVPSLIQGEEPGFHSEEDREFDVFISHASEDKDDVVRPLAYALKQGGPKVWYDEFELKIGDSLRRKIDSGLAKSRFGIVVFSKAFLTKGWTNYELDGLVTRTVSGEQILLPIWHNITKTEIIDYSPSLADKLARNTTTNTVKEIAEEIVMFINGD